MKSVLAMFIAMAMLTVQSDAADQPPTFTEKPVTGEVIKQLQKGGYVLYVRHGNTDASHPDRAPSVDLNDCMTQRPLTEEGRLVMIGVGQSIRKVKIPVGEVIASPLCRAKESALAAFGEHFVVSDLLMYTGNMTTEEKKPVVNATRRLLSTPVSGGGNRVLVAHAPNLMDMMGYFPKPEGTVVVFKPLGGNQFEYLGSIAPQQWKAVHE